MINKIRVPAKESLRGNVQGWAVYEWTAKTPAFLWIPFKIIAPDTLRRRKGRMRTLHVSWNPIERRFAQGSDLLRFKKQEPDVYAGVAALLAQDYNREWLLRYSTEEEIEQEIAAAAQRRAEWKVERAARAKAEGAPASSVEISTP